ncbi:MAG: NAD-dependent epimerase/dehydratase family protein, partial [Chloroflexota bacterium]
MPRLLEHGDSVRVLARQREQGEALRARGAAIAIGDLLRPETLGPAVAGVEAVVHLAAFFRGATPEQAHATNMLGTLHLARACIAAGVPRFIFASTNLVYGAGHGRPAREDDAPRAEGGYPASKIAAEQALQGLHRSQGLGLRILRLAFVYGDGDSHLAEVVPILRPWPPMKRLHMVHHADVAQAVALAMEAPDIDGRTYNVADDEPVTAAEILRLNGEPVSDEMEATSLEDAWEGIVDTARIKDELGFRPL